MMSDEMDAEWGAFLDRVTGLEDCRKAYLEQRAEAEPDLEMGQVTIDGNSVEYIPSSDRQTIPPLSRPTSPGGLTPFKPSYAVSAIVVECDYSDTSSNFKGIESCQFSMADKGVIYFRKLRVHGNKMGTEAYDYLKNDLNFESLQSAGRLEKHDKKGRFAKLEVDPAKPPGRFKFSPPAPYKGRTQAYHLGININDQDGNPTTVEISGLWTNPSTSKVEEAMSIEVKSQKPKPSSKRDAIITVKVNQALVDKVKFRIRVFKRSGWTHKEEASYGFTKSVSFSAAIEDEEDYGIVRNGKPGALGRIPGKYSALVKTFFRWNR